MRYVLDKGGWSEDYFFEDFELELFNLKLKYFLDDFVIFIENTWKIKNTN